MASVNEFKPIGDRLCMCTIIFFSKLNDLEWFRRSEVCLLTVRMEVLSTLCFAVPWGSGRSSICSDV